jgi:hypothetical protein
MSSPHDDPIDKRGKLDEYMFDYQITKDHRVLLFWYGKHIKTLAGKEAHSFINKIDQLDEAEAQLLLAKVTGNFKRGNERREP